GEEAEHEESGGEGREEKGHRDGMAAHSLAAGAEIPGLVVAVIATAESAAVRDLPGSSTAQPGLALDLDAIADDRHNYSDGGWMRSSWLVRPAAGSPGRLRRDHIRTARNSPPAGAPPNPRPAQVTGK